MTDFRKDCRREDSHPLRKTRHKTYRRMAALCLISCLLISCLSGCGASPSGRARNQSGLRQKESQTDTVHGQWTEAKGRDEFFDYIYVLDHKIERCESFWVNYSVSFTADDKCDNWIFYVRSGGEWYEAANFYMSSGRVTQKIELPTPVTIDAVTTYPDCDGDLSWNDDLKIYNVKQASYSESNDVWDNAPQADRPSSGWISGSWSADTYHINDANVSAWVLDTPIYNCERLKVAVEVEMLHNTSCADWKVYTWTGSSWNQIGSLYLPGGNGEGEADIRLDHAMTISRVVVVPKISGTYSWNLAIAVCDMT